MTAQQSYDAMVKGQLAPGLRALGFKGSGRHYALPSETHWALLGLQSSYTSTDERVRFTVNLLVVSKSEWAAMRERRPTVEYPTRPSAGTLWGPEPWDRRLGHVMGVGDKWWEVRAGEDTTRVAAQVIDAVETYALPAMEAEIASVS
jgi:hypothetical protein